MITLFALTAVSCGGNEDANTDSKTTESIAGNETAINSNAQVQEIPLVKIENLSVDIQDEIVTAGHYEGKIQVGDVIFDPSLSVAEQMQRVEDSELGLTHDYNPSKIVVSREWEHIFIQYDSANIIEISIFNPTETTLPASECVMANFYPCNIAEYITYNPGGISAAYTAPIHDYFSLIDYLDSNNIMYEEENIENSQIRILLKDYYVENYGGSADVVTEHPDLGYRISRYQQRYYIIDANTGHIEDIQYEGRARSSISYRKLRQ